MCFVFFFSPSLFYGHSKDLTVILQLLKNSLPAAVVIEREPAHFNKIHFDLILKKRRNQKDRKIVSLFIPLLSQTLIDSSPFLQILFFVKLKSMNLQY